MFARWRRLNGMRLGSQCKIERVTHFVTVTSHHGGRRRSRLDWQPRHGSALTGAGHRSRWPGSRPVEVSGPGEAMILYSVFTQTPLSRHYPDERLGKQLVIRARGGVPNDCKDLNRGTRYSARAICQSHLGGQENATLTSKHHPSSFDSKFSVQKISILTVLEATVFRRYESSDSNVTSLKKGIPTESIGYFRLGSWRS